MNQDQHASLPVGEQPQVVKPRFNPADLVSIDAASVRLMIAHYYPEPVFEENLAMAYISGGLTAARMLGLSSADCHGFLQEWSRHDELMLVASMYVVADRKSQPARDIQAASKIVIATPSGHRH